MKLICVTFFFLVFVCRPSYGVNPAAMGFYTYQKTFWKHQVRHVKPLFDLALPLGEATSQVILESIAPQGQTTLLVSKELYENLERFDLVILQNDSLSITSNIISIHLLDVNSWFCLKRHDLCNKRFSFNVIMFKTAASNKLQLTPVGHEFLKAVLANESTFSVTQCSSGNSESRKGLCFSKDESLEFEHRLYGNSSLITRKIYKTLMPSESRTESHSANTDVHEYTEFPLENLIKFNKNIATRSW